MDAKIPIGILGSGNIGTDLAIKIHETSSILDLAVLVGIEASSDGLARARDMGTATTHEGIAGLERMEAWSDIQIVFDATSASAHEHHSERCLAAGKRMVDLTPAALGPYCVPVVNMDEHLNAPDLNMVTCGGQATIPIVSAVSAVADAVPYAEIVASISSRSAGPGTRANIDEFTETTAQAIQSVGGAQRSKAIIVLNPADPPLMMRDTVYILSVGASRADIESSITSMVAKVADYVPGYRLKQAVQFEDCDLNELPDDLRCGMTTGLKTTVFLEVEGAGHFLPRYAGNLDIMTSAAMATGEKIAARLSEVAA